MSTATTSKITSSDGQAGYVFSEPAAFLIDAIPGARAAHGAWTSANAEGARLAAEREAAGIRLRDLRRANALAAEIEPAEVALRAAQQAVQAATSRALTALRCFDGIVFDARAADDSTHRLAASAALTAQARAVEARAALVAALDERDVAWSLAGAPGVAWHNRSGVDRFGGWRGAQRVVDARVDHFPTAATGRVANGDTAEHVEPDLSGLSVEQAARAAEMAR